MRILFLKRLLLIGAICFWPAASDANVNLRLTAPKVRMKVAPGASKSGQMAIENPTEQPVVVRCYLEDWFYTAGGDGGKDFRPAATTARSCASWISFSPAEFTLKPFGRQNINYRVSVPASAQGGHYAVLFFETVLGETQDEQGMNVLLLGRLGSLFYLEPEGTINKQATLSTIEVKEEKTGLKVRAAFKNTGNVDITASGSFNLIDADGFIFARGQFNDAYTLAGDEVTLEAAWDKQVAAGSYDLIITLDLDGQTLVEERQVQLGGAKTGIPE